MEELISEEPVVIEPSAPVEEVVAPVEEPAVEEVPAEEPVVEEPVVEEAPKKRTKKVAEPEPEIPADVQVVAPELPRSGMVVARSRKRP